MTLNNLVQPLLIRESKDQHTHWSSPRQVLPDLFFWPPKVLSNHNDSRFAAAPPSRKQNGVAAVQLNSSAFHDGSH